MPAKKKSKSKSKIGANEVRTPVNLRAIAQKNKFSASRSSKTDLIPYIKPRESTPLSVKSNSENIVRPSQSLSKFSSKTEHYMAEGIPISRFKQPLSIEVNNLDLYQDFEEESKDRVEFQIENEEFIDVESGFYKDDDMEESFKEQIINKYKEKYKKKIKDALNKQNEVHKFRMDSLKQHYEGKLLKYKEIIKKMQRESDGYKIPKQSHLLNPLIEENLWLKQQLNMLKSAKFNTK